MIKSKTIIATPPGATIKEQLSDRDMTQKEFASRMNMSEKHISHLINGEVQLTPDMALRLEMVLGLPAHFWSNLENIYREKLIKVQIENEMDADLEIIKKMPYNEMAKNGWIENTRNAKERVYNLRKFFEVVQLGLLCRPLIPKIVCRKLGEGEKSDFALIAWAQKAKLEARNIQVKPINIKNLIEFVPEIRKMTLQDPSEFCTVLEKKLADCGIALVFLPHIGGSFLHGATFYDGPKIVVGITLRGKDADRFWFSLFHEIGHVILGHINQADGTSDEDENAADAFACNALIPTEKYDAFTAKHSFEKTAILKFSKQIGIDPGIVVGRLQKEQLIPFSWYNELKIRYDLKASS